jgi:hypothetical protein
MDGELSQTEIKDFLASNGLDLDVSDERDEALEAWQQECNFFIRTFANYLEDRLSVIEHRLDRLEQLVKEWHRYQKDGI